MILAQLFLAYTLLGAALLGLLAVLLHSKKIRKA
jgi:LPXTG-motif cell wall-anchored protein